MPRASPHAQPAPDGPRPVNAGISGWFAPKKVRLWGGFSKIVYSHCDAELSTGENWVLGYQGNGRKRTYFALDANGKTLAYSHRIHATGWRSFVNPSLWFSDAAGTPIMEYSGRIFPTALRFGDMPVPCRTYARKWFRSVLESDFFEFEQKGLYPVRFIVKQPRYLLPALCFGYFVFVSQAESSSSGE